MKVSEVMTHHVLVVSPDETIEKAAGLMGDANVGIIPVLEGKRLVGVVTDRDNAVRGMSKGGPSGKWLVGDVMTENVHFCLDDDDIADVTRRMGEMRIRRMPVFDRRNVLAGIVSLDDIATRVEWEHAVIDALRKIAASSRVAL